MKSSDEMVKSLLERREKYNEEQNRKKAFYNRCLKYCAVFAGVIVIASFIYQAVPGKNDIPTETVEVSLNNVETDIKVNKVSSCALADLAVKITNYENETELGKIKMIETFENATNLKYSEIIADIPGIYSQKYFHYMELLDRPIIHDYVFDFRSSETKHISIKISPYEKPLKDLIIVPFSSEKSKVNGVDVTVYGFGGYFYTYIAEFVHNGLYYEIEAADVSVEELEEILKNVLS